MAVRYWVGGGGVWDNVATSHWSLTSNGASGASAPTSSDSVIFDANSGTGTITVSDSTSSFSVQVGVGSVTFTPYIKALTLQIGDNVHDGTSLQIYGNVTFSSNLTLTEGSYVSIPHTLKLMSGDVVFETANLQLFGLNIEGANVSLSNTLNLTNINYTQRPYLNINSGSLYTNNYTVNSYYITVNGTSTFSFANSVVYLGNILDVAPTATINSDSSTIKMGWDSSLSVPTYHYIRGGSKTYNNVEIIQNVTILNPNNPQLLIYDSNIFNSISQPTLNYVSDSIAKSGGLSFTSNNTINSLNFNVANSTLAGYRRNFVSSYNIGNTVTLTVNSISNLVDIDFRDINAAGNATWSGTRLGDCGGNYGITFNSPKTVYLVGSTSTTEYFANSWSNSSGGAKNTGLYYPLPKDTVIIDNNSSSNSITFQGTSLQYLSDDNFLAMAVPTLDFTQRTNLLNANLGAGAISIYGDLLFPSSNVVFYRTNRSLITAPGLYFNGRDTDQNILTSNLNLSNTCIIINTVNNNVNLLSTLSTGYFFILNRGNLNLNSYSLYCNGFFTSIDYGDPRSINFAGNSYIIATGNTVYNTKYVFDFSNTNNLSLYGNPVLYYIPSNTLPTYVGINTGYFPESNTFNVVLTGNTSVYYDTLSYVNNFDLSNYSGTLRITTTGTASPLKIYGNVRFSSTMSYVGGAILNFASTNTTPRQFTSNGVYTPTTIKIDDGIGTGTLQLQDSLNTGNTFQLYNGTLDLNGKTISVSTFNSSTNGIRGITFNSGNMTLVGNGTVWTISNTGTFTTTSGSGVGSVNCTGSGAKTFGSAANLNPVYNFVINQGGAGTLTILTTTANTNTTFYGISSNYTNIGNTTILFTGNANYYVTSFTAAGTGPSNILTANSSSTFQTRLISLGGTQSTNYVSLNNISGSNNVLWFAGKNSANNGNNPGWLFNSPLIQRLTSSGDLLINGSFDETTSSIHRVSANGTVYASQLDEVTINPINNGLARKIQNNGVLQISGIFDETTGFS